MNWIREARPSLRLRLALWSAASAGAAGAVVWLWGPPRDAVWAGVVLAILVAGSAVGGYLLAARALRPLREITATAQRLSTKNLDERIRLVGSGGELRELADTFNAMLDRIFASFQAQRRFVANASHELRTPLTVMRTEIEVALSNPEDDVAELRHMAEVVRDGCARANDLIESLLWLARAEAEGARLNSPVRTDLADCVSVSVTAATMLADELGLSLASALAPAPVVGEPSLLERVAGNLIENAIRYNVPGGRVWVLTGGDDEVSWLVVGNTGKSLTAESVPNLFEPFNRGDTARVGRRGAGLGLSIVRAACDAHRGTVRATPVPDGGGLEVRVEIPTPPAADHATAMRPANR
ncbi:signal transduction histidine kinase [Stackebrandtia albiflava]|uniref:histidine kinase n=1 Tax=Stackebrandtia albiflava TaxID=406432 RepID=A0A562VBK5_9ACTN|nr:HAMP domain-containing sensor histidine kinase [Stackebrandtia albiflava]TWJ15207.1 signal transduction histidine kinase [Stackebrandtia albiflava]